MTTMRSRHRHRLLLVVGDVDDGEAEPLLQVADLLAHLAAQAGVEIGQRLVEQQHRRLQHQRARDRDALLLSARQLGRQALVVSPTRPTCASAVGAPRFAASCAASPDRRRP